MTAVTAGVGATEEISLRVSAATLARVLLPDARTEGGLLALEHKATLTGVGGAPRITVQAQPFGGAARLRKLKELKERIGPIRFDSERSRAERDFRIYIQPGRWDRLVQLCRESDQSGPDSSIDADPRRELVEEFTDVLGIVLRPEQYSLERIRMVIEREPAPTSNLRAPGVPTARLYWVDEVWIKDDQLIEAVREVSQASSVEALKAAAARRASKGGRARANGILLAPLARVRESYLGLAPAQRSGQLPFRGTLLGSNVPAILDGVDSPKFNAYRL